MNQDTSTLHHVAGCGCAFHARRLFTGALLLGGGAVVLPAWAREGVDVGAQSSFSKLVSAEQIEKAAQQNYLQLMQQANSKGVPVKLSDYINLNVRMGGTLANPQLKTGLKEGSGDVTSEIKQQAADFAKQAVDSAKTVVAGKTNELKDSAKAIKTQAIRDLTGDLGKALSGQKDSTGSGKTLENTQKNAEKTLKNTLNSLFNKKSKDSTKTK